VNAQSAATDAKVTAQEALPTRQGKGRKAAGKTGLAAALLPGSRKGAATFAHLMSAKVAVEAGGKTGEKSLASLLMAAASGLKGAGRAVPAAHGEKADALKLPSGLLKALDESEKLALGKEEKSDGRKKIARLIAPHAGAAAQAGADTSRTVEGAAVAEKRGDAPAVQVGGTRTAQNPRTVLIHVVDLRKRVADKSPDGTGSSQKIAQASPAAKEPGALFMLQPGTLKDTEAPRKVAPASAASPQSGLERLREMAGSELLRASNLVLRDGGGEIRLLLKPESLGSVRIRMNLVDNKVEGRIIVDTSAVKQVIDQSIDALSRALTAGGFQTSSLEVSVGGQNADNGRRMQEPPAEVRRAAAQGFERNIPGEESLSMGDLLVNLFV
jgi:flagellar hook-length control protein FliK